MEVCQRPDKSYFQELKDLESLINTCKLVQTFLPKQADTENIKNNSEKSFKGMHLSVTVKEMQAGHLSSSSFKDIYLYLAQNKLPNSKAAIRKAETLAEKYILLDSLLKINFTPEKEMAVLAILESCVDNIILLYHSSLFAGHQDVIKTYLTISDKFFYTKLNTLFKIIHKRVSYLSTYEKQEATN